MTHCAIPVAATLMLARHTRILWPTNPKQLEPITPDHGAIEAKNTIAKLGYTSDYNRHHDVHELPQLEQKAKVRAKLDNEKTWINEETIINQHQSPRSFPMDVGCALYRRNHKHLAKIPTGSVHPKVTDSPPPPKPPPSPDPVHEKHEKAASMDSPVEQPFKQPGFPWSFRPTIRHMRWIDPLSNFMSC